MYPYHSSLLTTFLLSENVVDDNYFISVVREGTQPALGVSKADMALRIKREQVKRRMLKNLHIFVSPTRLCINNLPSTVTDKGLGKIFKKYAPKEAVLTEVRMVHQSKAHHPKYCHSHCHSYSADLHLILFFSYRLLIYVTVPFILYILSNTENITLDYYFAGSCNEKP